jgi:serine phosphatase RsbU (regulator of sigma subunit)
MNAITTHGAEIGSGVEVVLISLALAERYRQYRKEKEAATKHALEVQEEANRTLDKKVKERTVELQEANEELNQVNEELHTTLETVQEQSKKIAHINQEISAGINYAKRIQDSMLPKEEDVKAFFSDAFVLFLPRDVVSGDFYFALKQDNLTFIAAVDCTGHGVPGGFMSMVGMNLLQEIIKERKVYNSGKILDELHLGVQRSLRQKETQNRDGMDAALCVLDENAQMLQYSGAKNPLLGMQKSGEIYLKGTRQSIGGFQDLKPFEVHTIALDGEGFFFLYSDGFQDQFGGEEKRKFMSKRFRKLLISLVEEKITTPKETLLQHLENWRTVGEETQTDDILVLGFKA